MAHFAQKISFREKLGYSLGDAAANLVFQVLMAYQFYFFTAIMGLQPTAAGALFLIGRFFDAFTDPLMGILADRTRHRWGRFRPWILWSALPFAGIFWLTFTSPGWSPSGQLVYAYVMYFLLMGVYTVNNVPYCALNGVMTGDVDERTSLSSCRFVAVTVVQFIVQGLTWPLVAKLGQGSDAHGWSVTMGIFAIATVLLFFLCFLSVKERIEPDPNQTSSAKQDIIDTFRNRPWLILFCATFMIFIMLAMRGGSMTFYMKHYVENAAMSAFLIETGLYRSADSSLTGFQAVLDVCGLLLNPEHSNVPNVAFGWFMMAGTISTLIGVFLSKTLSKLFGKRVVFTSSLLLTAASTVWLFFIPGNAVGMMVLQALSWGLAYGPTVPLLWSMIADAADYSEWKTDRRATGFVFAGMVFALKFGLGIGGFIQGMILTGYGYKGGIELTGRAILGIRLSATVYPAVFIVLAAVILMYYPITKELNYRIGDELAQRRKSREIGESDKSFIQ